MAVVEGWMFLYSSMAFLFYLLAVDERVVFVYGWEMLKPLGKELFMILSLTSIIAGFMNMWTYLIQNGIDEGVTEAYFRILTTLLGTIFAVKILNFLIFLMRLLNAFGFGGMSGVNDYLRSSKNPYWDGVSSE